jgi:hypothetical protein
LTPGHARAAFPAAEIFVCTHHPTQTKTMKMKIASVLSLSCVAVLLAACASSNPAQAAAGGVKAYPLNTCIVSDNELGSMGKIVTTTYQGQEVKFCCKPCVKKFNADPARYLSKLPKS